MLDDLSVYIYYSTTIVFFAMSYYYLDSKYFKLRACVLYCCLDCFFTMINYFFELENFLFFAIECAILFSILFFKIFSYIREDEINDENVCLIFYKPKKLKQFVFSMFGFSYSSAGLVINRNIYQMRYESETLQEIPFKDNTEKYLKEKYLIIDTGFKSKNLKGNWRENLLSQHARQKATLGFRFNCLRSLRFVLNQIKGYEYKDEVYFPCIYLVLIKLKRLFKII